MSVVHEVAAQCVERMETQGHTGKARDKAALEFFCGAGTVISLVNPEQWNGFSHAMFLVAVRGFSEVEKLANKKEPAQAENAEPHESA